MAWPYLDPDSMGAYHMEQNLAHEWSDEEDDCGPASPMPKTCNRCGAHLLHWENSVVNGWRLYDSNGKIHTCSRR